MTLRVMTKKMYNKMYSVYIVFLTECKYCSLPVHTYTERHYESDDFFLLMYFMSQKSVFCFITLSRRFVSFVQSDDLILAKKKKNGRNFF